MVTLARPTLPLDIRLMNGVSTLVWTLMAAALVVAGAVVDVRVDLAPPWIRSRSCAASSISSCRRRSSA